MRRRLTTDERGFALVVALGVMIVLGISATTVITYTASNQRSASRSANSLQAVHVAEAGMNNAYGVLNSTNTTVGGNPSAANLLGCSGVTGPSDANGPSNCTSPSPKIYCVTVASPCTAGAPGTASVYGYFSGTNPGTFNGVSVAASSWLIYSTGYALNAVDQVVVSKTVSATVKISALNAGAVASVWNHIFITGPDTTPDTCQLDFGGNGITVNDPLYVIGNLCLGNASLYEVTGGQAIDLQVGGKLVFGGGKVGLDSTHGIWSGVVVGGCTSSSVTSGTTACSPTGFNYWVKNPDVFVPNDAPEVSGTDQAADYASFDPGPQHTCATSSSPPNLADSVFDNDTVQNNSAPSFELVPNSSYTCISKNGSSVGQLSWNNTTKILTVKGSIFFDGNITVSQSATYTGTAVIENAGTVTFNGNSTTFCATGPPCDYSNWQGASGNNSMLTFASLKSNASPAIDFVNNSQGFQGSLWTQPSSSLRFQKNGTTIAGPLSVGSFGATFNNASFKPLPVIKNMPTGAPVPPNTGASIGPLNYLS